MSPHDPTTPPAPPDGGSRGASAGDLAARDMPGTPRPAAPEPDWAQELADGLAAAGGQGSVEPELEVVRLLRHVARPDELSAGELDGLWSAIDRATAPAPAPSWSARALAWWRDGGWRVGAGSAALGAAALAVVLAWPRGPLPDAPAVATRDPEPSMGALLDAQFRSLEPGARAQLRAHVDRDRAALRRAALRPWLASVPGDEGADGLTGEGATP